MPSKATVKHAEQVADAFGPSLLVGEDLTLVVLVCDAEGWNYCLRGSLPHAIKGLQAALDDALNGEGFAPYNPTVA